MSFINSSVYSNALRQEIALDLYIPTDRAEKSIKKPDGIIYFLHGLGSSQRRFREFTATNRYALDNHLAVVYISAPQSFYCDMKYGNDYYTYITEELPQLLDAIYGLKFPREKTFLSGLSMGGYGTLKIGLSKPEMFGAIVPMSAPCDMKTMTDTLRTREKLEGDSLSFIPVFGDNLEIRQEDDPYYLLKKVSNLPAEKQPRIRMMVGKQDDLAMIYDQNVAFDKYAKTLPLADYKMMSWNGVHDYAFWDRAMMHAIAFFLQNKYDEEKIKAWRCEIE